MEGNSASLTPSVRQLIRETSAWLPMAMSAAGLVLLLGYLVFAGNLHRNTDEGTPAHIFQLLMTAQIPIVAYFAFKWLPRNMRVAIRVVALQGALWLLAVAAVIVAESISIS